MADKLSLALMGDLFPNDRFYADGKPLSPEFGETLDLLERADIRHATFLMPLSERGEAMDKVATIRAHPDVAQDVAHLGLDVISVANNHVFDYGPLALQDTMDALTGIGSQLIGAGDSAAQASTPAVIERNGSRVGIIAFSCLVPAGAAATDEGPGISGIRIYSSYEINPLWAIEEPGEPEIVQIHTRTDAGDQQRAEEQVEALRGQVDILCVSVHWGYGAGERPAEYQQPLGRAFIDAGADVVFGHHVHGVQGIEVYKGKPILYSTGTLIGRQQVDDPATLSDLAQRLIADMTPDGYVAELQFNGSELEAMVVTPTTHDEVGLPHIATDKAFDRVAERITRNSSKLGTELQMHESKLTLGFSS